MQDTSGVNFTPALEKVRRFATPMLTILLCAAAALAQEGDGHVPTVEPMTLGGGVERGAPCVFIISRTGRADEDMVVFCEPNGTATEGVDHVRMARQVTIPRGFSTATIILPLIDDEEAEEGETVGLTLLPTPIPPRPVEAAAPATQPTTRQSGDASPPP